MSWGDDLERYQHQRRDVSNWPVPDPNPRTGPMSEIDPYRGSAGVSQQACGPEHGRDTLRNEFHDPQRQRAELEAESRAAQRTILRQVPGSGPFTGGLRQPLAARTIARAASTSSTPSSTGTPLRADPPTDSTTPAATPTAGSARRRIIPTADAEWPLGTRAIRANPSTPAAAISSAVIQPEGRARDPDDRAVDNWMGNPGAKPTEGRGRASEGMYVPTTHHGRRDLFAVVSGVTQGGPVEAVAREHALRSKQDAREDGLRGGLARSGSDGEARGEGEVGMSAHASAGGEGTAGAHHQV